MHFDYTQQSRRPSAKQIIALRQIIVNLVNAIESTTGWNAVNISPEDVYALVPEAK